MVQAILDSPISAIFLKQVGWYDRITCGITQMSIPLILVFAVPVLQRHSVVSPL